MTKGENSWLVTGAEGFLGSYVTDSLLSRGKNVIGVDNLSLFNKKKTKPRITSQHYMFANCDIRDQAKIGALFDKYRPTAVIHLAAVHFIPETMKNPRLAMSINIQGTQNLLSVATEYNTNSFWFASTGDVYAPSPTPHFETSAVAPFNIYGLSKHLCEQLIAFHSQAHPEMKCIIGRLFKLYGPGETSPHFIPEILKQIREQRTPELNLGNLWTQRDFVPVSDAAKAIIELVEKAPIGLTTVNIGSGQTWALQEIIEIISTLRNQVMTVSVDSSKVRRVDRINLQADVNKLKAIIGWVPGANIKRGLLDLLVAEKIISTNHLDKSKDVTIGL